MAGTKGMTHYSTATKLEAVRLHEEEGLTYAQVAAQLELRKADRIEIWVRQYREEGEAGLSKKGSGRPHKARTDQERIAQLEMENALLKKLHTELRTPTLARRDIGSLNTTEKVTQ
jgi:transposase-like protein